MNKISVIKKFWVCVMITTVCFMSGCVTSKLVVTDKRTDTVVTIEPNGIETYLKTVDYGRFTVVTEDDYNKEVVIDDLTILK